MDIHKTNLLVNAICTYLPYGICVKYQDSIDIDVQTINPFEEEITGVSIAWYDSWDINQCKLYLRPISSMTEEEKQELRKNAIAISYNYNDEIIGLQHNTFEQMTFCCDWLNSHHFDYRGLIPMGLALEVPEDMYKNY